MKTFHLILLILMAGLKEDHRVPTRIFIDVLASINVQQRHLSDGIFSGQIEFSIPAIFISDNRLYV